MTSRNLLSPLGRASLFATTLALLMTPQTWGDQEGALRQRKTTDNGAKSTQTKTKSKTTVKKKKSHVVINPKFDPNAEHVGLFDGAKKGAIGIKVVANNSFGGRILIENLSQKPLTVDMPEAFVGVQVLRQFGGGGMGMGGMGRGGMGMGGMGQSMGMGMGGMGMGGMGMGGMGGMGMGGGMFSVPPERIVQIPFHSVCLEHGKTDPDPTMHYTLIPIEQYTKDENLAALITLIGTRQIDPLVAQAAAWNLSSKMSWEELASKPSSEIGYQDYPYFSAQALNQAQMLVAEARGFARDRAARERDKKSEPKKETAPAKPDYRNR